MLILAGLVSAGSTKSAWSIRGRTGRVVVAASAIGAFSAKLARAARERRTGCTRGMRVSASKIGAFRTKLTYGALTWSLGAGLQSVKLSS